MDQYEEITQVEIIYDEVHGPVYYIVAVLSFISIILSIYLWLFQISAIIYSYFHFGKWKHERVPNEPGVTIIKPIKADKVDLVALASNLETFFQLNYKNYEINFCFEATDDPAVEIVKKLKSLYPHINAQILTGIDDVGVNPKINNMLKGYVQSNHPYVWICDQGIRVKKDVLIEMIVLIEQNKRIGLVHQLPFTHELHRNSGLGNVMEHIYFGSQHGRVQICAHLMGQVCITGMSNLIRKEALEKACGGLVGLSNYIAEDYFMTKKMESAGYQFQLSRFPALQNQGDVTIKSFFQRMSRWTRLRITMIPGVTCIEPFSEIFLSSFLTSLAISWWLPTISIGLVYCVNVIAWFWADLALVSIINGGIPNTAIVRYALCWLMRENSTILILLVTLLTPNTKWHGNNYRINSGGKAERVKEEQSLT